MKNSDLIGIVVTALAVLGVVLYRFAWAASSVAAAAGQGRLPSLPKRVRNWLFGERTHTTS